MPFSVTALDDPGETLYHHVRDLLGEAAALLATIDSTDADDRQIAVHEVRKRCKEVRAIARMLGLPADQLRRFDTAVAEAARRLGATRDQQVMRDTLQTITADIGEAAHDQAMAALADVPHADGAELATSAARTAVDAAQVILDGRSVAAGRQAVLDELRASYRLARRRLQALGDEPVDPDAAIHAWRKAVKRLWYQARAVQAVAPRQLDRMVGRLDELGDLLGDDHDLTVLVEALDQPQKGHRRRLVTRTVAAARKRQRRLRRRSLRLGDRIFADRPKRFAAGVGEAWEAAGVPNPSEPTEASVRSRRREG